MNFSFFYKNFHLFFRSPPIRFWDLSDFGLIRLVDANSKAKKICVMYREKINEVSMISVLDIRKIKVSGKYPVRIQITHKRVQKYLNTGKDLTKEEWDKLPTTRVADFVKIRESIKHTFDLVTKCVQELTTKGEYSYDRLCVMVGKSSGGSVNTAFQKKINQLLEEERVGSMKYYTCCLRSVEMFAGKDVPFENITVQWLEKFEAFMLKRKTSYATIGMRMRGLRTIMNIAKKEGLIKEYQYPFGRDKYEIKTAEGRKKALTLSQISQVLAYKGNRTTTRYRDIWFFIYLCNGINVADLVMLKFSNIIDGEICFMRQKTLRTSKIKREITVPVTPQMQAIIDRWGNKPEPDNYIFNLIRRYKDPVRHNKEVADILKRINKRMKIIGESLGIGKITTYTARHSFATVLKRSGANIAYISESLGHADLKTTESYLASFEKEERLKNADLLTRFIQPA